MEKIKKLTVEQILEKIVEQVQKQGGRALQLVENFEDDNDIICVYQTDDNKLCGHSLFVQDKFRPDRDYRSDAAGLICEHGDDIHIPQAREFTSEFWLDIQSFHDSNGNWNDKTNTLSKEGEIHMNGIIKEWSYLN